VVLSISTLYTTLNVYWRTAWIERVARILSRMMRASAQNLCFDGARPANPAAKKRGCVLCCNGSEQTAERVMNLFPRLVVGMYGGLLRLLPRKFQQNSGEDAASSPPQQQEAQ